MQIRSPCFWSNIKQKKWMRSSPPLIFPTYFINWLFSHTITRLNANKSTQCWASVINRRKKPVLASARVRIPRFSWQFLIWFATKRKRFAHFCTWQQKQVEDTCTHSCKPTQRYHIEFMRWITTVTVPSRRWTRMAKLFARSLKAEPKVVSWILKIIFSLQTPSLSVCEFPFHAFVLQFFVSFSLSSSPRAGESKQARKKHTSRSNEMNQNYAFIVLCVEHIK